ncbi:LacI family DNA-binding transcriptional regulator [Microbacterium oryzae]|uniref:LacI family DNA-binding transcriptional regulator n=1 Tax=Microbacterium oryzae TaxID=743009 RepID=UPI0025B06A22|nr:LacI family DNA-binding transcriptional regulator [Microbacterium oryzae]MDN3310185.1 LacI family DNA-binding transcriptional regulator [Microbacterium oryzae]
MNTITLADVARAAGVSPSTASRVLSGSRPVGSDVAARVHRVADELGYTGNGVARALRKRRTDSVGMVVPSILNPFFAGLVDSIEAALHDSGMQLLLCDARQSPDVEAAHLRALVERNVDGIVVSPCHSTASIDAVGRAAAIVPVVQLDRWVDVQGTDWVGMDDHRALRMVLEHLVGTSARSVAFLTSELTNSSTADRVRGFRENAAALGLTVVPDGVVLGDFSVESGQAAAETLLARGDRPDAIVCADDLIAIGVLSACRARGIGVPRDVQVTGIDDIDFGRYVVPTLTTLAQPTVRMAAEVMRLLGERVSFAVNGAAPRDATRLALSPRLVVRESTRAVS